jgi:heterodisulfide reductase subunit D
MGVENEMNEKEIIARYRIEDCTRCKNECAAACPVYRHYGSNHPQGLARLFLGGGEKAARDHALIWTCVTCKACTDACPFKVEFADFIRELRIGRDDHVDAHGGLIRLHALRQASSKAAVPGKVRQSWLDKSLDVNRSGEIAIFAGCLALFDAVSGPSCEESFGGMAKAAVRLLNRLGVSPVVLEDERCCGRDLFDIGEREAFKALARHNVAEIGKSKAKKILTLCPECAFTLKDTYAKELGEVQFEVQHVTEHLAGNIDALDFRRGDEKFAFHDPCYLCRYLGVSEAPRKILAALSSEKPVELERTGSAAPCCGAGSWVNHGPHTRTAVDERLREAARCGADVLATACPKCTLLYSEVSPACSWKQSPVVVRDLITLAAARLRE